MGLLYRFASLFLLSALTTFAQQAVTATPPETSSAVMGHVYLGDTKGPARKASVSLKPEADLLADTPRHRDPAHSGSGVTIIVEAGFDGSFSFAHVRPGTYFVIADYPGYVSPYTALELAEASSLDGPRDKFSPAQKAAQRSVLKSIPRVTVETGLPSRVDVTLEHGAAIGGTLTYDDGNPATSVEVALLSRVVLDGKSSWAQPFLSFSLPFHSPDDLGHYRISGLPVGTYLVQIGLNDSSSISYSTSAGGWSSNGRQGSTFMLYSGNSPRLEEAKPISLGPGEEHTGEDFSIPISKLRTISGHIVSAADGHVINTGQIGLYRADDNSFVNSTEVSEGSSKFTLNFVYDGDYILSSAFSADADIRYIPPQPGTSQMPQVEGHPRHLYGAVSQRLHVTGNMEGVTLAVPEPTAEEAKRLKDALQQQDEQNSLPSQNQPPSN